MEKKPRILNTDFFLHIIEMWILAARDLSSDLYRLERKSSERSAMIIAAISQVPPDYKQASELANGDLENRELDQMRFFYKGPLLLVALNKIARWTKKLIEVHPKFESPVAAYLSEFGEGKHLRDILEHDDEYFTGGGRYPEKYIVRDPEKKHVANASTVLVADGEIFLGHQLSVQRMMAAVDQLYADLVVPNKLSPPPIPPK